jgi:UDP-3-O-[3-hydroxymyristoyl] glucosamine N-acyltransferase
VRFALRDLVERFGGDCGADLSRCVTGFAALDAATTEQLAFVAASRYRDGIASSAAAAVLVTPADAAALPGSADRLWTCRDPYLQFARIAQYFEAAGRAPATTGIDATAVVAPDAAVDPAATIGPHATIGAGARIAAHATIGAGSRVGADSRVGEATTIHAGVVIYPGCTIGARCIVHAGAVIGADGFGFAKDGARWVKIPQTGGVVVGDDVEIGANTTIDRGTLDDTRIGDGVKLDNQIQIAHNVQVGDDTIMAACVGIAGSAIVGKRCMIGGAARIMGHVTIADDTVISTQTFVSRSITKAGRYTGYYPMAEHAAFEKSAAVLRRLDLLRDRVRRLESAKPEASEPPDRTPE